MKMRRFGMLFGKNPDGTRTIHLTKDAYTNLPITGEALEVTPATKPGESDQVKMDFSTVQTLCGREISRRVFLWRLLGDANCPECLRVSMGAR